MAYTTHGYHIDETSWKDQGKHVAIIDCGGAKHCASCSYDTAATLVSSEAELLVLMHRGLPQEFVDSAIARMTKEGYKFRTL